MDNIFITSGIVSNIFNDDFGNRYTPLAGLIRKIHDEVIAKKLTKKDKATNRYPKQISIYAEG